MATAGTYTVSVRLASPSGVTDGLHIASSSGANLSGNINVPATGGWQTWTTVVAAVTLPAGQQTLTIDQDNTLSPDTTYTLTGWTQGSYAYIGVSGGATASTWTSSSGWTQQTVSFTTGSSGTVTVFVHGWYGQGNVYADDLSVS